MDHDNLTLSTRKRRTTGVCIKEECVSAGYARKMCVKHYFQARRVEQRRVSEKGRCDVCSRVSKPRGATWRMCIAHQTVFQLFFQEELRKDDDGDDKFVEDSMILAIDDDVLTKAEAKKQKKHKICLECDQVVLCKGLCRRHYKIQHKLRCGEC